MDKKAGELDHIGVAGAGSWGTALANLLADKGYTVDLWAYEKEVKQDILTCRENRLFLPGIELSEKIIPTNDLEKLVTENPMVLLVVPSHTMRNIAEKIASCILDNSILITASKGIEEKTHLTMSAVLKECIPSLTDDMVAVLSGPSFAKEVAEKVPTAISIGSKNIETAIYVQHVFATDYFRVYVNDDPMAWNLAGPLKM